MRAVPILAAMIVLAAAAPAWANKSAEAEAAFADNRDDEAIVLFGQAIQESAGDASAQALAYFGRGEVQAMNRRTDLAIEDFTAALALKQDDASRANTYYSRGEAYGRKQMIAEAVADYSESIRLAPGLVGVHYARGALLRRLKRNDEALVDFEAELKINPTSYRTLTAKADMLGLPMPPDPRPSYEADHAAAAR
ncbi:MAG TPA: hypothetical protein VL460_04985 [Caulobacteraceae bacterium]|nr:hypothetical protein [Caulobacteraceae bacterium]